MTQANNPHSNLHDFFRKANLGSSLSINELKEKENEGKKLASNEKNALYSFDRYRINELNKQPNEEAFHKRYMELQVMANLYPFEEFLKEDYLDQDE
jgi:hypothetical protein